MNLANITTATPNNLTSAETGFPRVQKHVYEGVIIAFVPFSILAVGGRMYVNLRNRGRIEADDAFLICALCFSMAAWGLAWHIRDINYLTVEINTGMRLFEPDDVNLVVSFFKYYNAYMVMNWTSIYSVKFSYLFFFRKLISRIQPWETFWWIIMGIQVFTYLFSGFFSFSICPDFTMTFTESCPDTSLLRRSIVYLYVTTVLDIFTDILVISLPMFLIMKLRINLKRKIVLVMALCLSIFMIIIAVIRMSTSRLPSGILDTVWLALWQCVENNTGIILVSLTAFRSLFTSTISPRRGQQDSTRRRFWSSPMSIFRKWIQICTKDTKNNGQEKAGVSPRAMMHCGSNDTTLIGQSTRSQKIQGDSVLAEDPRDQDIFSFSQTFDPENQVKSFVRVDNS